jgi:predicted ATPase
MALKIRFKNFKLFRDWQTLEIAPITILIGKNNTGKTAVLKLPVLIHHLLNNGLISTMNRIKLGSENNVVELGADFNDLVYNRSNLGVLELEVSNNGQFISAALGKTGLLELVKFGTDLSAESTVNDTLNCSEESKRIFEFIVDYIGGIRVEPEYNYLFDNSVFTHIGVKGQHTYPILIQDFKKSKTLIRNICDWYKNNFEGWEISVIENKLATETNYSIVVSANKIDAVNIKQSGQGIHQALPLVVRSFMPDSRPTLIIIEEPEIHLHPAAHGNLVERFVDSYIEDNNKRYLIETHSQNFILRLRRLVAEGKISCKDVKIYYVDYNEDLNQSLLEEINVDSGGGVDKWPEGVFGEAVIEARSIINANINDVKNVD